MLTKVRSIKENPLKLMKSFNLTGVKAQHLTVFMCKFEKWLCQKSDSIALSATTHPQNKKVSCQFQN